MLLCRTRQPETSDLHHELSWANALLLLASFQLKHVYSTKHGIDSALECLKTLSCNLRTWRELQPAVCERWSKPILPYMDSLLSLANTRAPVCNDMSVYCSPSFQLSR
jgi:hypothetical protein